MSFFSILSDKLKGATESPTPNTQPQAGGGFLDIFKKALGTATNTALKVATPTFSSFIPKEKVNKVVSSGVDLAKDVAQGIARTTANTAITAGNLPTQMANKLFGGKPDVDFRTDMQNKKKGIASPRSPIPLPFEGDIDTSGSIAGQVLFGGKPVRDFNNWSKSAVKNFDEFRSSVTGGPVTPTNPKMGPILVLGTIFGDLSGTGGPTKKAVIKITEEAVDILAKAKKAPEVLRVLVGTFGLDRKMAIETVDDLIKAGTPEKVKDVLKQFADSKIDISDLAKVGDEAVDLEKSGFGQTVAKNPNTVPEVAAEANKLKYEPITNADTIAKADAKIAEGTDEALKYYYSTPKPDTDQVAVGMQLIKKFQDEGNYEQAISIINDLAPKLTKEGQAIQIVAMYNKLTPEGVVRYTGSLLSKVGRSEKLTPEVASGLKNMAEDLAKMPDGEAKVVATAQMVQKIKDLMPVTFLKKVGTVQTMFQLLNPKTIIRNIVGNTGFAGLENVSDTIGSIFDSALSFVTGKATKALPNLKIQGQGFMQGFKQGVRDARLGIDTSGGISTQFDLPTSTFKGGLGGAAEKTLNTVLRGPDRAFYQAAYDNSLAGQIKVSKWKTLDKVPATELDKMKEVAHYDGLYKTFQDDSALAYMFTNMKKALNLGKEFGVGDFILKYPKTPANLISRGLAYSPAGFLRATYEMARPLMGQVFDQKRFIEAFSRATVGSTMLVGTGALLHKLGIITGKREDNANINATQRREGLGAYKINASALKRFILSGFDAENAKEQKGDKLVAYDWFQPQSIGIAMGANYDEGEGSAQTIIGSILSGIDTIAEQPLVQGVTRWLKSKDPSEGLKGLIESMPTSFTPTLVNQIRQLVDDKARSTYDTSMSGRMKRAVMNRIPGLSDDLEPSINVFGENKRVYEAGDNNFFNVFFNPAITTKLKKTPEGQLILDIYDSTGEVSQSPKIVEKSLTINGEKRVLSPEEYTATQRFVGTYAKSMITTLTNQPEFKKLDKETQAQEISNILSDISSAAKMVLFGNQVKKMPSQRTQMIIQDYLQSLKK